MSSVSTESQYGLRHINGVPVWNGDFLTLRDYETAALWFRAGLEHGEQERLVHIHFHTHIHTHTHTQTQTHTHTHTDIQTYRHTDIHRHTQTYTDIHRHTQTYTDTHTDIHRHSHAHARTHHTYHLPSISLPRRETQTMFVFCFFPSLQF